MFPCGVQGTVGHFRDTCTIESRVHAVLFHDRLLLCGDILGDRGYWVSTLRCVQVPDVMSCITSSSRILRRRRRFVHVTDLVLFSSLVRRPRSLIAK